MRAAASGFTARFVESAETDAHPFKGRHPRRLLCEATDPRNGKARRFRNGGLDFDPTPLLTSRTVEVLIRPAKPSRYLVDTDTLQGLYRDGRPRQRR